MIVAVLKRFDLYANYGPIQLVVDDGRKVSKIRQLSFQFLNFWLYSRQQMQWEKVFRVQEKIMSMV